MGSGAEADAPRTGQGPEAQWPVDKEEEAGYTPVPHKACMLMLTFL